MPPSSAVGLTKAGDKELSQAKKMGLLKNTPAESLTAGPEIIPRPPLDSG
jgi:hypothetical protein